MGPKTPNNDIEQTDDDETMRLVVDDLASAVEMKEQDESWEKEKLVWAKRKAEREQHLKEMKELADQEAELKQELLQKDLGGHNLNDILNNKSNTVIGALTEKNLKRLGSMQRGSLQPLPEETSEEINNNIQSRRYKLLDKIRINAVNLANYHNHRYHVYKNILFSIFRVPLILLAGLNSFFSVGLQGYMSQTHISLMTAVVSLFCGILTSIELLLNLQKRMEMEQETSKNYYKLAVTIYNELGKAIKDRGTQGDLRDFLTKYFNEYQTLFNAANTVNMSERNFIDEFELYIKEDNCTKESFNFETGTNVGDENKNPQESSSDENYSSRNRKLQINTGETTKGICPQCFRNLITSGLMTCFYCCTSSEYRIERLSKAERKAKHKERKHKMGITKSGKYTFPIYN